MSHGQVERTLFFHALHSAAASPRVGKKNYQTVQYVNYILVKDLTLMFTFLKFILSCYLIIVVFGLPYLMIYALLDYEVHKTKKE